LKSKWNRACVAVALIVVLIFAAREIGWLDFNLHTSNISATHAAVLNRSQLRDEDRFSYNFSLLHGGEVLYTYNNTVHGSAPLVIDAVLETPLYTGNTTIPLVRDFKMEYVCNFSTVKSPDDSSLSGSISGTVNARILGLCSRRTARQLALDSATKYIQSEAEKWGKL
jgi:hypothetical protein